MRLKIFLEPKKKHYTIPINYNYMLSSFIYEVIQKASKEFADFLHSSGYISPEGKPYKFFCFSKLFFEQYRVSRSIIKCSDRAYFFFGSPMSDSIIQNLIEGFYAIENVWIGNNKVGTEFHLEKIEIIPRPKFHSFEQFHFISPVSVSTVVDTSDGKSIYYYRPSDKDFFNAIERNLRNKFKTLNNKEYEGILKIRLDDSRPVTNIKSKLITIKEGTTEESHIKAFTLPIIIEAEPIIIQLAYDAGLGERNSLGFGMIERFVKNK